MGETTTLNVNGMTCSHCEKAVHGSVSELTGVNKVKVDLDADKVEVNYEKEKIDLKTIIDTIKEQGYDVI